MKKLIYLIPLLLITLLLSGCNDQKKVNELFANMDKLDSYEAKASIESNLGTKVESTSVVQIDKKNNIFINESTSKDDNETTKTKSYQILENKKLTSYTSGLFGEQYVKQTIDYDKKITNLDANYVQYVKLIQDFSKAKKVKSDIKGLDKYKLTIGSSLVSGILDKTSSKITGSAAGIYVYADKNYIHKIVYDLSNVMNSKFKFKITLEFSKFNKLDLKIPEDVVKNAKTVNEIDFSNNKDLDVEQLKQSLEASGYDTNTYNDVLNQANDKLNSMMSDQQVQNKIKETQDYLNSPEGQRQMEETQKRAQEYMNSDAYKEQQKKAQELYNSMMGGQ